MMGMICLITLAIIVIIIISAMGFDKAGRFNAPKDIIPVNITKSRILEYNNYR
jgi:hypothetical protein